MEGLLSDSSDTVRYTRDCLCNNNTKLVFFFLGCSRSENTNVFLVAACLRQILPIILSLRRPSRLGLHINTTTSRPHVNMAGGHITSNNALSSLYVHLPHRADPRPADQRLPNGNDAVCHELGNTVLFCRLVRLFSVRGHGGAGGFAFPMTKTCPTAVFQGSTPREGLGGMS